MERRRREHSGSMGGNEARFPFCGRLWLQKSRALISAEIRARDEKRLTEHPSAARLSLCSEYRYTVISSEMRVCLVISAKNEVFCVFFV